MNASASSTEEGNTVADRLPDQHPILRVEIHAIAGLYIVEIQKLIELLKCAVDTQIGQGMDVFFDAVKRGLHRLLVEPEIGIGAEEGI